MYIGTGVKGRKKVLLLILISLFVFFFLGTYLTEAPEVRL